MFKTCPACGSEFQAWVAQCPDCEVPLQLSSSEAPPVPPRFELPPARELVAFERGDPWHLREIAERLQQGGLSCRIDAYPPDAPIRAPARKRGPVAPGSGPSFALYVRHEDVGLAQQLRAEHLKESVPGAEALAVETGAVLSDCPACGEALSEGATSCASCGLEFPELEEGA